MANTVTFLFKAVGNLGKFFKTVKAGVDKASRGFKKFADNTGKAAKKFNFFNRAGKKTQNALDDLKKKVLGLGAAYLSVSKILGAGGEFQDALADLSAITGATGKDLNFFSNEALKLAKASNVMQKDVVRAFADVASAKSELLDDPKALSNITEQALLLANAAGISVPDAVRASVGALNQFNVGADQAARFTNVLAASAQVGAARIPDVIESLKNAGPVAAQFGLSFENVNSLLQVLAKNGIKGAEAGTALRGTLVKLEKIAGGKFAPSRVGIIKSLEIIEKLGLNNTQLIQEFGEENLKSILILRKNIPLIKQWGAAVTGTNTAQEQADKNLSTFNAKVKRLGITLNEAFIKTFLRLEPILTKQVVNFTNFLDSLDPEKINGFADSIGILIDAGVFLAKTFGFVLKKLEAVGVIIGEVTAALVTFNFSNFSDKFKSSLREFSIFDSRKNNTADELLKQNAQQTAPLNNQAQMINKSKADVNIKLSAPEGTIESIKSKTSGKSDGLNVGVNMEAAL